MSVYNVSTKCLVCEDEIQKESSVLFLCDCIVPYCKSCAYRQVAVQPSTYNKGLMCPICRQTSENIRNIKGKIRVILHSISDNGSLLSYMTYMIILECHDAETTLCHRAMEYYG